MKCIDHGHLLDEATARLMADKDVWWSLQPFTDDEPSPFPDGSPNRIKQLQMFSGTDAAYALAKKFKIKTAWGTDILFSAANAAKQGTKLSKTVRWYSPAEALKAGHSGQRRTPRPLRSAQSLSRKARRRRRRCARRPAPGERRPHCGHPARRGSGEKLRGDHEGREAHQEPHRVKNKTPPRRTMRLHHCELWGKPTSRQSLRAIRQNKVAAPSTFDLSPYGLTVTEIHHKLSPSKLYKHAIYFEKDASIAEDGALVTNSAARLFSSACSCWWSISSSL